MRKKWKVRVFLFLGILLVLSFCGCKKTQEPFTYRTGSAVKEKKETKNEKEKEYLYLIEEVDTEEEMITLASVTSNRLLRYKYSLSTKFLNKYGDSASIENFTPGCVVTIGDKLENSALSYVKMSDKVWTQDDITKYALDIENRMLTIGETPYHISKDAKIFSGMEYATLENISDNDVLRVVGLDKTILSVVITSGHGYLQLVNADLFKDTVLCIGDKIYTLITGDMSVEVPEGTYAITVASNGYGGTKDVTITKNEITVLDLEELKGEGPKFCKLKFVVAVDDAKIYLDGKKVKADKEMSVVYGKHSISVVAKGYDAWEKTLFVNSESATITLDLSDEKTAGNKNKNSNANNTSNTSNNNTGSNATSGNNTQGNSTNTNTSNTNNTNTSGSNSSSSSSSATDAQLNNLKTISNMLTTLLGAE